MVAFSTAAPLLAVTYSDQIDLWNWKDNNYLGEMTGERRPAKNCYSYSYAGGYGQDCLTPPMVLSLVFSPDGHSLVVGSQRPDAEIWDVSTRKLVGHLEGHVDWVTQVVYSSDGRYIAAARPQSTQVYLWDAQTQQLMRTWRNGDEGEIQKLLFSSDSQRLYVGTQIWNWAVDPNKRNGRVRAFDVHIGAQLNEFGDELFILQDFSLSPDEKVGLLRYHISEVVLWDIESNHRLAFWADSLSGSDWKLSPDGRSLVTVSSAMMKIWDVPSRSLRKVIVPHSGTFGRFAISPDSQTIAIGQGLGLELRDIHTGEITARFDYYYGGTIAFSATGERVAAERFIFDVNNPENPQVLDRLGYSFAVAFSTGDTYLAARNRGENPIHLWQQQDGKYTYRYALHSPVEGVPTFIPSPDSVPVLAVVNSKRMAIWELREQPLPLLILELDVMWPLHFSGDGRYLFANSEDGLQIWDWREQKRIQHPPVPEYFAVSRDSSVLLTWNYETGQMLIWDGRSLLPPEPAVSYDINLDGAVNILDLVLAASQFGQTGANLTGDVNRDGRVNVSDLGYIGSHLGETAAAPALLLDDSNPIVSYHSSVVERQFQALTALESVKIPSRGTHIARHLLKAWLSRMELTVTETKLLPNYPNPFNPETPNYPNPFNPETWIPYQLSESAHVRIRIYDAAGYLVRALDLGTKLAGSYLSREGAAYWDGRNNMGEVVSSGKYFYTLEAGEYRRTQRLTVVR